MHPTTERIHKILLSVTQGMTPDDWCRHPSGKWSAADVLEHLSLTYSGTARGMQKVLDAGAPIVTPRTFKQKIGIWYITRLGRFPEGRQSPAAVRPTCAYTGEQAGDILQHTLENLAKMDSAISDCERRFGPVRILDHPVLGALNPSQWRRFHSAHARHHAVQIERLRQAN
jgi:hypothetical protein